MVGKGAWVALMVLELLIEEDIGRYAEGLNIVCM